MLVAKWLRARASNLEVPVESWFESRLCTIFAKLLAEVPFSCGATTEVMDDPGAGACEADACEAARIGPGGILVAVDPAEE